MSRGQARHLETCTGPPPVVPLVLTEEELRAQVWGTRCSTHAILSHAMIAHKTLSHDKL